MALKTVYTNKQLLILAKSLFFLFSVAKRKCSKWIPKYQIFFLRLSLTEVDINQACISNYVDVVTEQQWDTGRKEEIEMLT